MDQRPEAYFYKKMYIHHQKSVSWMLKCLHTQVDGQKNEIFLSFYLIVKNGKEVVHPQIFSVMVWVLPVIGKRK